MGFPYYAVSEFYKKQFGERIHKIPVAVAESCPNREGIRGMKTCSFCDVWGSAAHEDGGELSLEDQITKHHQILSHKFKAQSFLIYFQAYTNTFKKLSDLRDQFERASQFPFVKGFVIGTRPDCLSKGVLDLWREYSEKFFVSVELGAQTFFEEPLVFLRRGHTVQQTLNAIEKIAESAPQVDLGIHLMFGLPGDSAERIRETAEICNHLPITNVKLHNLHVLKSTELEKWHAQGKFTPLEFSDYCRQVEIFLQHLSPEIYIHRLAAYSPRWEELVAPAWTANKMQTHQRIIDFLHDRTSRQGQFYPSRP